MGPPSPQKIADVLYGQPQSLCLKKNAQKNQVNVFLAFQFYIPTFAFYLAILPFKDNLTDRDDRGFRSLPDICE